MAEVRIENWRAIEIIAGRSILVGEVSGHPYANGWTTTSELLEIADDQTSAITASRAYVLSKPLPEDMPLPPSAQRALESRLSYIHTLQLHTQAEQLTKFLPPETVAAGRILTQIVSERLNSR